MSRHWPSDSSPQTDRAAVVRHGASPAAWPAAGAGFSRALPIREQPAPTSGPGPAPGVVVPRFTAVGGAAQLPQSARRGTWNAPPLSVPAARRFRGATRNRRDRFDRRRSWSGLLRGPGDTQPVTPVGTPAPASRQKFPSGLAGPAAPVSHAVLLVVADGRGYDAGCVVCGDVTTTATPDAVLRWWAGHGCVQVAA